MIKIIQIGLGPIGQQLTRYLTERKGIQVVGGVDLDPDKTGKDIGELAGINKLDVLVSSDLGSVMEKTEADIAVISTVSSLQKIEPQIKEAASFKLHVVSTCEELMCPFDLQPEIAERIDQYCRGKGIACIGTGVNPGFLMDYLPAVLSSVCQKVDYVQVDRYQDAGSRRLPFQQKIGAGLTQAEFKAKEDSIRHVGLKESVYLLARALGWEMQKVEETLIPVFAEETTKMENILIEKGNIAGVEQIAKGYKDNEEVISLNFKAAVGLVRSYDSIEIIGNPGFKSVIDGGINGDVATSAIIVNTIRSVNTMNPGLKTMLEIPAPAYYNQI
ncbi:MAG: dihydrodipicolinate reductase [Gracilimonas sp.]|uniref:NAD(P)H-dependent amine dehydrogenase family protein n=1 Tax=Gracilimonas sp. TaxID=1974203 RepID=UPI0019B18EE7|nr:hypothetical protein [Gracilimonas sp.]MBD3616672.1 dihydrodipicolinate reductase [Gracilimonas sp.]